MTTVPKCQAKNPAVCVDPQCPEKKFHAGLSSVARENLLLIARKLTLTTNADDMFATMSELEAAQFEFDATREGIQELELAHSTAVDDLEKGRLFAHLEMAKERFNARYGVDKDEKAILDAPIIPLGGHTYDVPSYTREEEGTYPATTGSKFTGYRPVKEIAQDIRKDLAEAQAKNYLPSHLEYSVTIERGGFTSRVNVSIRGLSEENLPKEIQEENGGRWRDVMPEEVAELKKRVEIITGAYNQSRTQGQIDYFQETYYQHVSLESTRERESRFASAADAKRKRENAAQAKNVVSSIRTTPRAEWLKKAAPVYINKNFYGTEFSIVPNTELIIVGSGEDARVFDIPKLKRRSRVEAYISRMSQARLNDISLIEDYEVL